MKSDGKRYLISIRLCENVYKMLQKEATENNFSVSRQATRYIEKLLYEKYPDCISVDDFTNERAGKPKNSKMTNKHKRHCIYGLCQRLCGFVSYENRNENIKIADSMDLSESELMDLQIQDFMNSQTQIDCSKLTFVYRKRENVKRIQVGVHLTVQSCNFIEEITNKIACSKGAILDYIIEWWQNNHK